MARFGPAPGFGAGWQDRFFAKVSFDGSSCWIWNAGRNHAGYGRFNMFGPQRADAPMAHRPTPGLHLAHRVAYSAMRGEPVNECLMHSCDRPECVNPWHLTDATRADNNRDAIAKGRAVSTEARSMRMKQVAARGERAGAAKLTEEQVREIRAALAAGESSYSIAKRYGVHKGTPRSIAIGRTWRHVA